MRKQAKLTAVFDALKSLLLPYASQFIVAADTEHSYQLVTPYIMPRDERLPFATVSIKGDFVCYNFMPLATHKQIATELPPLLAGVRQGKTCLCFKQLNESAIEELKKLTKRGFDCYKNSGYI